MAEPHTLLNGMSEAEAADALTRCCGSARWVEAMLERRPFASTEALYQAADRVWNALGRDEILEAFSHHPQIGADLEQLRAKFAATSGWSSQEQAGVREADEQTLLALRDGNLAYRERFGYLFITCATGKSAATMLAELRARLHNAPDVELGVAAAEHAKIARLRLGKLS